MSLDRRVTRPGSTGRACKLMHRAGGGLEGVAIPASGNSHCGPHIQCVHNKWASHSCSSTCCSFSARINILTSSCIWNKLWFLFFIFLTYSAAFRRVTWIHSEMKSYVMYWRCPRINHSSCHLGVQYSITHKLHFSADSLQKQYWSGEPSINSVKYISSANIYR